MKREFEPLLVRIGELPEIVGLHERTIRKLRASGQFPRHRSIGGTKVWSYEELKAWVAEGCPSCHN